MPQIARAIGTLGDALLGQRHEPSIVERHEAGEGLPRRAIVGHPRELIVAIRVNESHGADEVACQVEEEGRAHQFRIAQVVILVLVERLEPLAIAARVGLVQVIDGGLHVLAHRRVFDHRNHGHDGVPAVVQTLAVKRVNEARCVAHDGPAVTSDLLGAVG